MNINSIVDQSNQTIVSFECLKKLLANEAANAYLNERGDQFAQLDGLKKRADFLSEQLSEFALSIKTIGSGEHVGESEATKISGPPMQKEEFEPHFMDALRELGGSGKVGQVIDLIERKLQHRFNTADLDYDTPSDPDRPRWKSNVYGVVRILESKNKISRLSKGRYTLAN
jgi:hypothetical protein